MYSTTTTMPAVVEGYCYLLHPKSKKDVIAFYSYSRVDQRYYYFDALTRVPLESQGQHFQTYARPRRPLDATSAAELERLFRERQPQPLLYNHHQPTRDSSPPPPPPQYETVVDPASIYYPSVTTSSSSSRPTSSSISSSSSSIVGSSSSSSSRTASQQQGQTNSGSGDTHSNCCRLVADGCLECIGRSCCLGARVCQSGWLSCCSRVMAGIRATPGGNDCLQWWATKTGRWAHEVCGLRPGSRTDVLFMNVFSIPGIITILLCIILFLFWSPITSFIAYVLSWVFYLFAGFSHFYNKVYDCLTGAGPCSGSWLITPSPYYDSSYYLDLLSSSSTSSSLASSPSFTHQATAAAALPSLDPLIQLVHDQVTTLDSMDRDIKTTTTTLSGSSRCDDCDNGFCAANRLTNLVKAKLEKVKQQLVNLKAWDDHSKAHKAAQDKVKLLEEDKARHTRDKDQCKVKADDSLAHLKKKNQLQTDNSVCLIQRRRARM